MASASLPISLITTYHHIKGRAVYWAHTTHLGFMNIGRGNLTDGLFVKTPIYLRAFIRIVSSTATKTTRTLAMSIDCEMLWLLIGQICTGFCGEDKAYWAYTFNRGRRLACTNRRRMYSAASLTSALPVYSGKYLSRGI